jgi:hypothetical protein
MNQLHPITVIDKIEDVRVMYLVVAGIGILSGGCSAGDAALSG